MASCWTLKRLITFGAVVLAALLMVARTELSGLRSERGVQPSKHTGHAAQPSTHTGNAAHALVKLPVVATLWAPSSSPQPLRPMTITSIDFHIGPIADFKFMLGKYAPQVVVVDKSLSGACGSRQTCAGDLIVLAQNHGSMYHSLELKRKWWTEAGSGDLVKNTQGFICSHPAGMCELFMPTGKSLLVHATTRYDLGREDTPQRMAAWAHNLRVIAAKPWNVVAANNLYDVQFIRYFTGLTPVYIQSLCAYNPARYSWRPVAEAPAVAARGRGESAGEGSAAATVANTILITSFRPLAGKGIAGTFFGDLHQLTAGSARKFVYRQLRDVYGHYSYEQLVRGS
jgi:hypothetical protein